MAQAGDERRDPDCEQDEVGEHEVLAGRPDVDREARLVVDVQEEDRQRGGEHGRGREGEVSGPPGRHGPCLVRSDGHRRPLYWPLWRACRLSGAALLPRRASISRSDSGSSRPSSTKRQLDTFHFGLLSTVIVTAGFFQTLLDFTAEEALVKYGFDYTTAEDWGRLRRLFRAALRVKVAGGLLAMVVLAAIAPFADQIFNGDGLEVPFLIAVAAPVSAEPGRRVQRCADPARTLRRARLAARGRRWRCGSPASRSAHTTASRQAVIGLVVSQAVATVVLGVAGIVAFHRFPHAEHTELGQHRRGILGFVVQSSLATGVVSLRGTLSPILLGVVTNPTELGYFRIAQSPQNGFASLSAPVRLILLTEQTRDWSRGAFDAVFASLSGT